MRCERDWLSTVPLSAFFHLAPADSLLEVNADDDAIVTNDVRQTTKTLTAKSVVRLIFRHPSLYSPPLILSTAHPDHQLQ
jgi:hypothetical protein